jgi:hypothetical protein
VPWRNRAAKPQGKTACAKPGISAIFGLPLLRPRREQKFTCLKKLQSFMDVFARQLAIQIGHTGRSEQKAYVPDGTTAKNSPLMGAIYFVRTKSSPQLRGYK